jgi:hypothetical protein
MYKIQPVIEHIEKVYGLELVPCSIPRSQFQYFKRSFYLFIHNKVSKKLFYFLRDKVSPIKFLDERPKGEIWFRKRNSEGKVSIEVEIKPLPTYQFIFLHAPQFFSNYSSGLFHPINKEGENYEVKIYHQLNGTEHISFPLNHINGNKQVDYYFSKEDELKTELRNFKLGRLLK